MRLKAAVLMLLVLLVSSVADAQENKHIFLDSRPLDDPFVIDVSEITGQYSKLAVQEYQKGIEDARKGNPAGAEQRLKAAIAIEPNFFNAHNSLAILFHRTFRYRDAEREYLEAARLNPRSAAPMLNLASLHIEEAIENSDKNPRGARGMLNDALVSLRRAGEIQPGSPLGFYLTGVVYFITAFYEESESDFKKALASGDPRMSLAHLALADIYFHLEEWDGVVVQLDEYLNDVPFAPNRVQIRSMRNAAAQKLEHSGP